jgi:4,5-DOPA dioxygenase extradiol
VQGSPDLSSEAAALLNASGFDCDINASRGLDHGAWVPLMHLFPKANVPAFQVSLPLTATPQSAYALGQALAPFTSAIKGTGRVNSWYGWYYP